MATLSDYFKNNPYNFSTSLANMFAGFNPATRNLPNGGGSYQSPAFVGPTMPIGPTMPVNQQITPPPVVKAPPIFKQQAPIQTPPPATPQTNIPPQYINPKTGGLYTAQEIVANMKKVMPPAPMGGDIGTYAGNAMMNPNQTVEQMNRSAYGMSNARNDIATGTTDPYKVGNQSGIAYSPSELAAIEKAYAGIYDPAISDVFTKLDAKAKQDAADLAQKNKLAEMAQQHAYNMAEKGLTIDGTSLTGEYVKGANPTVDAWAQRIFDGSAKITDIPASDKGMRNAVTVALMASGNDLSGKPTVTELGKAAKKEAESIMADFEARKGTSVVGGSRAFGGALWGAVPGTDAYDFKNSVSNLISNLSLEGVKYLKGQGAVSDAERALLANAVTKLKLSQSEGEFKETLQGIIDRLSGSDSNVLHSPDGTQEVTKSDLTAAELKEAIDAGWY